MPLVAVGPFFEKPLFKESKKSVNGLEIVNESSDPRYGTFSL
jgi:hypothetical protein